MFEKSIIVRSGQRSKALVSFALVMVGGAILNVAWVMTGQLGLIAHVGMLIGLGGLAYAALVIRCPRCRLRWVPWAIKNKSVGAWLKELLTMEDCPGCKARFP